MAHNVGSRSKKRKIEIVVNGDHLALDDFEALEDESSTHVHHPHSHSHATHPRVAKEVSPTVTAPAPSFSDVVSPSSSSSSSSSTSSGKPPTKTLLQPKKTKRQKRPEEESDDGSSEEEKMKKKKTSMEDDIPPPHLPSSLSSSRLHDLGEEEEKEIPVVRVYCDGVWDLFHYGHARALQQAKNLFPRVHLIAGICNDETTHRLKGLTVLNQAERAEMLQHCRYVDEVIEDAPWKITEDFLERHQIDWVAGWSEGDNEDESGGYGGVKELGKFHPIQRTEGISASEIVLRIVKDYDNFVKKNLSRGISGKELGIGLLKEKQLLIEDRFKRFKEKVALNLKQKVDEMKEDVRGDIGRLRRWWQDEFISDFMKKFGEKKWFERRSLTLGVMKLMAILRQGQQRSYPHPQALEAPASSTTAKLDEKFRREYWHVCKSNVPGWNRVPFEEFNITPMSGGLTNQLFRCFLSPEYHIQITFSSPSSSPPPPSSPSSASSSSSSPSSANYLPSTVLLRLYGDATFFDREKENQIFSIFSDLRFGPRLFGIFDKGRLEEFIFARTLRIEDLPNPFLSSLIAKKLAIMHSFDMPFPKIPCLFESFTNWLQAARTVTFPEDHHKDQLLQSLKLERLEEEVVKLQILLESTGSPIVFCHNDLQEGNIMWDDTNQIVRFIDFEYGNYNFRGFDIANHFCEWIFDYSPREYPYFSTDLSRYPNEDLQRKFIRNYLTIRKTNGDSSNNSPQHPSSNPDYTESMTYEISPNEVDNKEVESILVEVRQFTLASHLLWVLWGIIQAKSSEIQFGFLEYSAARLKQYYSLSSHIYPSSP